MNSTALYETKVSITVMENTTSNNSIVYAVSGVTSSLGMMVVSGAFLIICLWTIVLNGLLILCFWINKHESWISHSKNILSITIIDLLVGVTTLMAYVNSATTDINRHECLASMGSCLASQTATSLNVLRFCVTRFYAISKTSVKRESPTSVVVAQTLVIWIVSVPIVVIPLTLWSGTELVLKRCAWGYLFPTHRYVVNIYILNLLTIPTLTTTVLYGVMSLKMWKIRNFVHPISESTSNSRNARNLWSETKMAHVQSRYCDISDLSSGVGKQSVVELECKNKIDEGEVKNNKTMKGHAHACFVVSKEAVFPTQIHVREILPETNSNQLSVPAQNIKARDVTLTPTVQPMNNRSTRISKVRTTIGILIVFINLTNLPFILVVTIQVINPAVQIPAVFHPLALFFLMLNSACNPVVYAIRIQPLRVAFFGMFKNCRNKIFANG